VLLAAAAFAVTAAGLAFMVEVPASRGPVVVKKSAKS
jgi:hypothetical protein